MKPGLGLTIAGFLLLGAVAVAGWVRQPAAAAPPVDEMAMPASAYAGSQAQAAPVRRVVTRQYAQPTVVERRVVEQRRTRPTSHSVAIVAGGAGAGAAIGGLAGGGKGAAIGALSGGAAGFIYDRLTRKK